MNDRNYKNTKVLILGLGLNQGGVGVAKFFAKAGAQVKVTDIKTEQELKPSIDQLRDFPNIEYVLGGHKYEDIDWADLIIRNPALKPDNQFRIYAEQSGKEVELDMGIFLQLINPQQIIGITGTKGKSTTSSLIYKSLRANNKAAVLAGNIGRSILDELENINPNTIVVLEISSFQLEAFEKHQVSPHIAVVTNIYPDHLNYYKNMQDYILAKKIIAKYQTPGDYLFSNQDDAITNQSVFLEGLKGQVIKYSALDLPENFKPILAGEHNRQNMSAALAVCNNLGLDTPAALVALQNFPGVEFRLQLIKEVDGIKIYNDSASTIPDATIQAIHTFPNAIFIIGGAGKNLEYGKLVKELAENTKDIFFLDGDATEEIRSQLQVVENQSKNRSIRKLCDNLEDLLSEITYVAEKGDIVVFSPGATSFNMFQNEFDRGRKFNKAVEKVFGGRVS